MSALAEKGRPENIDIAVNGYGEAMAMATQKMEAASGKGLAIADIADLVASATLIHVGALESLIEDEIVPAEAYSGIDTAIGASQNGYGDAILALAGENPVRAMEINLAAMEGRLNRAKAKAEENDIEAMEAALSEFQVLNEFGETISQIAQGLGEGTTTVEQLVAEAASIHLAVLGEVLLIVPDEEAQAAIVRAMDESVTGYERAVEALEETGALDDISEEPPLPEGIPDEAKEKLLKPKVPAGG